MNAAARLVNHQGVLSRGWIISVFLTPYHFILVVLIVMILGSALGLVYFTNDNRTVNANYQKSLTEHDRLHLEWGQLLLERSTLTMQARVQSFAENRLGMAFPESKVVVVIDHQN